MLYSQVKSGRRSGKVCAASGPCRIKGCQSCGCGKANCTLGRGKFNYDHCHKHGYVRGVICAGCNQKMKQLDWIMKSERPVEHMLRYRWWAPLSSYLAHWDNCPECNLNLSIQDCLRILDWSQHLQDWNYINRIKLRRLRLKNRYRFKLRRIRYAIHYRRSAVRFRHGRRKAHRIILQQPNTIEGEN